jgi:hypothetical protein
MDLTKIFQNAYEFNFSYLSLTSAHEQQIRHLKGFVENLNNSGTGFTAVLSKAAEASPTLKVRDEDAHEALFMISFNDSKPNDLRVVLSPVTTKEPLYGIKEGYQLNHAADRQRMAENLGCFLARRGMEQDILRETARRLTEKSLTI